MLHTYTDTQQWLEQPVHRKQQRSDAGALAGAGGTSVWGRRGQQRRCWPAARPSRAMRGRQAELPCRSLSPRHISRRPEMMMKEDANGEVRRPLSDAADPNMLCEVFTKNIKFFNKLIFFAFRKIWSYVYMI